MLGTGVLFVALLASQAGGPGGAAPNAGPSAPHLTLEVLNARSVGRPLLVFEDVIGPESRTVGAQAPYRAMFLHEVSLDGCSDCDQRFAALVELQKAVKNRGGAVVVVVTGKPSEAGRARSRFRSSPHDLVFVFDPYGFSRRRLGLRGHRSGVVLAPDGQRVAKFGPMKLKRLLEDAKPALEDALGEEDG